MSDTSCTQERQPTCWSIQALLIAASIAVLAGRILSLHPDLDNPFSPFFSANDRSRWATIKALGDDGTYEIDTLVFQREEMMGRAARPWDTIDKVRHLGLDEKRHFYSSKPTLLPTLLAYEYRGIRAVTGWNLDDDRFTVAKLMLLLSNVFPFAIYLGVMAWMAESLAAKAWSRYVIVLTAGMGTFLSTFAISLNNHLPAAIGVAITIFGWLQLRQRQKGAVGWAALAGASAAFAVSNELPSLSFFAIAAVAFLVQDWRAGLLGFLPAAGLIASAHFGTNWQAHQSWRPPYAHRQDGALVTKLDGKWTDDIDHGRLPDPVLNQLMKAGLDLGTYGALSPGAKTDADQVGRWVLEDLETRRQWALVQWSAEGPIEVREWDNWYDYEGSYWTMHVSRRSAVDQGEPNRLSYLFHMTFGHHGIWSLTPIWCLSLVGAVLGLAGRDVSLRWLAIAGGLLAVVCLGFYTMRPLIDRNYGGQTSGLRWMFWLIPFWLLLMLPCLDWMSGRRWSRVVVVVLLVASIASAMVSAMNPWVHPWLYQLWANA